MPTFNPLPSNRLRCCDWYIRCQRSLAVKPLNSHDAMQIVDRPPLTAVWNTAGQPVSAVALAMSRYQFTHVRYRTVAAGPARWQLANWCMPAANWLSESSLTATARVAVLDCGLWFACAALLRLTPQAKKCDCGLFHLRHDVWNEIKLF